MECNGRWAIDVAESGDYTFELRRWPREENRAITEGIPGKLTSYYGGNAIPVSTARIKVAGEEQAQSIGTEDKGIAIYLYSSRPVKQASKPNSPMGTAFRWERITYMWKGWNKARGWWVGWTSHLLRPTSHL